MKPDRQRLLRFARRLIQAESENPPGREAPAAACCQGGFEELGARIQLVEGAPGRPSLLADWPAGLTGTPALLWLGHLDVVPAGDPARWRHPPYGAVVEDGRLYGRGATDMKGPIASLLEALAMLRKAGFTPQRPLRIALVADEETLGLHGARVLAERGAFAAAAGIVGEPTGLTVQAAERGACWLRLVTRGVAAHASVPHRGDNAILPMAALLTALRDWQPPGPQHPLLGRPTLNVGTIAGGTKINMVPDRCEAELDRRLVPGEEIEAVVNQLADRLKQARPGEPFTLEIEGYALPFATPAEAPVTRLALEAVADVFGHAAEPGGMPGVTDGRYLHEAGVPTVMLGPGSIEQAHIIDEYVEIGALLDGARVYAALLQRALA